MNKLIAAPLLCVTLSAQALCPVKRPGEQPVLPDGEVATAQEIRQAQREADAYRLQVETYMGCGVMNRRQHHRLLTQLEMFMESYHQELMEFRTQEALAADK